jgi:hypothetical protein
VDFVDSFLIVRYSHAVDYFYLKPNQVGQLMTGNTILRAWSLNTVKLNRMN